MAAFQEWVIEELCHNALRGHIFYWFMILRGYGEERVQNS